VLTPIVRRVATVVVLLGAVLGAQEVAADIGNFNLGGQIYTKWLYRNNDRAGTVTWGNPFWPENFSGDNGVGSEFELQIEGRPSRWVTARVRLQSRFGSTWHTFWENGDQAYPEENTSAESLGMNHAEYIKLRGYTMEIRTPYSVVDTVIVGSSDLGFWNPWTVGRLRYIDRDNAKGVFFQGLWLDGDLSYTLGVIALPKLWAGPNWSTGLGDVNVLNPFYTLDYAYALHLDYWLDPLDMEAIFDIVYSTDFEVDLNDPDASGSRFPTCQDALGNPIPGCEHDQVVDLADRYRHLVATLLLKWEPVRDVLVDLFGGFSAQWINPVYTANGVAQNAGVYPMPFFDTRDFAARVRVELVEPFGWRDFTLQLEYFNIGEDWVSTFGARREADVLLTDGFISGGQLPTLNIANEFQDFDEPFFESCIGWHGITALFELGVGNLEFDLEGTFLTYNTNAQRRDVDSRYPDFLHEQGYTDTWFFDYANVLDRGRDPRAVYRRNQERTSAISVLRTTWDTGLWNNLVVEAFLKYIWDKDDRDRSITQDDYLANLFFSRLTLRMPVNNEMTVNLGGAFELWDEEARSGSVAAGFSDYYTRRAMAFGGFTFTYGGATFEYRAEYVHKYQERELDPDRQFDIFRSKAYLIVAW
jgi:hypothetical protein